MTVASPADASAPGLLARERIVAKAGFNRWLVPPAALAIHLCIGMAYGFSVFWKPLQGALLGRRRQTSAGMLGGCGDFRGESGRHPQSADSHQLQLEPVRSRLDVHVLLRPARRLSRDLGRVARAGGPAQGRRRRRDLLVRRPGDFRPRRLPAISSGSCGSAPA